MPGAAVLPLLRSGGPRPSGNTLKLKLNGSKFTGTLSRVSNVSGAATAWPIKGAKFQGSKIAFAMEHDGIKSSYEGKISADAVKGTLKVESPGRTYTRDWEAKCFKE